MIIGESWHHPSHAYKDQAFPSKYAGSQVVILVSSGIPERSSLAILIEVLNNMYNGSRTTVMAVALLFIWLSTTIQPLVAIQNNFRHCDRAQQRCCVLFLGEDKNPAFRPRSGIQLEAQVGHVDLSFDLFEPTSETFNDAPSSDFEHVDLRFLPSQHVAKGTWTYTTTGTETFVCVCAESDSHWPSWFQIRLNRLN